MLDKVTKKDCLYALQENNLSLKDANAIYDYFVNKQGIDFLMLEFILTVQEREDDPFGDLAIILEEENA